MTSDEKKAAVPGDPASPEVRSVKLADLTPSPGGEALPTNIAPLMDISLRVSVVLGETRMVLGELLKLGVGSVVELDRAAGDPIDILVNERLYARGELVAVGESFGVRITEIVGSAKPAVAG
ncbi:MAG: flagellar motor switch protein FliN [Elusimicrobia bacterium]|nr:flagellar motor switch protein FliN [Elusimicrobiota bacterium]MBP9127855.1 flagellar motor switch protein FliN [Elusimicrobiota bacterium]